MIPAGARFKTNSKVKQELLDLGKRAMSAIATEIFRTDVAPQQWVNLEELKKSELDAAAGRPAKASRRKRKTQEGEAEATQVSSDVRAPEGADADP